jgi:hypothetical protein
MMVECNGTKRGVIEDINLHNVSNREEIFCRDK